jgi:hypothetical protein
LVHQGVESGTPLVDLALGHLKARTIRGLPMRMLRGLGPRFVVETGEVVMVGIVVVIEGIVVVVIVGTVVAGVDSGEGVVEEGGSGEVVWVSGD